MDYLILGLTSGSLFAIAGFILREIGLRPSSSMPRWCAGLGNALMVVGVFVWGVTGAVALADMDDDAGRTMVLVAALLGLVGAGVSTILLARHQAPLPANAGPKLTTEFSSAESWSPPIPEVAEKDSAPGAYVADPESIADVEGERSAIATEERSPDFWLKTWLKDGGESEQFAGAAAEDSEVERGSESDLVPAANGLVLEAGFWAEDVPLETTSESDVATDEADASDLPAWVSALALRPSEPVSPDKNETADPVLDRGQQT